MKKPKRTNVERTFDAPAGVSRRTDRAVRRAARATESAARRVTGGGGGSEPVSPAEDASPVRYPLVCKLTAVVGQTGRTTLAREPFNEFGRVEFTLRNWPTAVDFEWELWWGSFKVDSSAVDETEIRTDEGTLHLKLQLGD